MEYLIAASALVLGFLVGWLIARQKTNELEKKLVAHQSISSVQLQTADENYKRIENEKILLQGEKQEIQNRVLSLNDLLSTANANLTSANVNIRDKNDEIGSLKDNIKSLTENLNVCRQDLATTRANNLALNEKLETQKNQMEELGKKFNIEFENIANKILETKTQKFTELNKINLKDILDPLGKNIEEFKKTVNETYDKESKERFSLGERVKELSQLNQVISEEARNLTKALKNESKTQGSWGEMILESILEKSGLRKGEEYFMEYELKDDEGNSLRSESENKKMRPDAVIRYPDNRSVIIDSKVSLNAFTRYLESQDTEQQKIELTAHVTAVKNRIIELSTRGYDDYNKTLDFVMMFIPSEPAYIAAQKGDPNIWNFAYEKRILLINPTNLIISLKLIVDLWKREYQNKNAQKIAERGTLLYDKFTGFVANLEEIGKHIDLAKKAYTDSSKQLATGKGNLISQAEELRSLGLKPKNELSKKMITMTDEEE